MMIGFCSWSGGKDSCLSLYKALQNYDIEVQHLVNMVNMKEKVGHGLDPDLMSAQADALDMEIHQKKVTWDTYEDGFKETINSIDPDIGVFGDMELQEHRDWVERITEELGVEPILPLWHEDPIRLYREFIDNFETMIIKIDKEEVDREWLGRKLDEEFLKYALDNDIHPMGENGEYHTFVVDCELFDSRVNVEELDVESVEDRDDLILNLGLE